MTGVAGVVWVAALARVPTARVPTARVETCHGCGACLLTCPEHALRPVAGRGGGAARLVVLGELCTGCGECVEICPIDGITLTEAP